MYKFALDLSGNCARMALALDDRLLSEEALATPYRAGAALALEVGNFLQKNSVSSAEIGEWTCGAGPGSFSGLRLASSLLDGMTFGREVHKRCVPGALSYAVQADCNEDFGGVLYDGRNREMIFFGVKKENGIWRAAGDERIVGRDSIAEFCAGFSGGLIAPEADLAKLETLFPEITGRVKAVANLRAMDLIFDRSVEFDGDLTKLVYIRPAVYC